MRGETVIELQVPTAGLIANVPIHQIPPNGIYGGTNMFVDLDGLLKPRRGYVALGTPIVTEQQMGQISYFDYDGSYQTIVAGFTSWQLATSVAFTNITGTPATGGADNFWRFTVLPGSNVVVFGTNGVDTIKYWHVGAATYTDLTVSNAPTNAKIVLTLGGRIVAFNTTESGTNLFYRIRWSNINDGTTWGSLSFLDLLDTAEVIQAAVLTSQLSAVVYTVNNAYFLYAVPGSDASAFAIEKIPGSDYISGPASSAAVVQAEGSHYWMGADGKIWSFNGTSIQTISQTVDPALQAIEDQSSLRRCHTCYVEPVRQVWFFFPGNADSAEPMHAIALDLRLTAATGQPVFTQIMTFGEAVTSSSTIVTTISPNWTNWVGASVTWPTVPYLEWSSIPTSNQIAALIGTSNNVYTFFSGSLDNATPIAYSYTSPLIQIGSKYAINITDFELHNKPGSVTEQVTVTFSGLLDPYSTPVLVQSTTFDSSAVLLDQALTPGSIQALAPEPQRYPFFQMGLSSAGVAGGGLQLGGGNIWVNKLVRGTYGQQ